MPQNSLHIVAAYHGMRKYVQEALSNPGADLEQLWTEHVLDPYWAEWAAGQFHEQRTRQEMGRPITDLSGLAEELELLAHSDVEQIVRQAYTHITTQLPSPLAMRAVCLFALDPRNHHVREQMNGVLGTCVGDNIVLQIHPDDDHWQQWVPYVLAHEYHHSVWGYNYFAVQGNTRWDLLTAMLTDGLADTFARQLYPNLNPVWLQALSPEQEAEQWQWVQPYLHDNDPQVYRRFMFGDKDSGTPAATGYTISYHIVQAYLTAHPHTTVVDLLNITAQQILDESGYCP